MYPLQTLPSTKLGHKLPLQGPCSTRPSSRDATLNRTTLYRSTCKSPVGLQMAPSTPIEGPKSLKHINPTYTNHKALHLETGQACSNHFWAAQQVGHIRGINHVGYRRLLIVRLWLGYFFLLPVHVIASFVFFILKWLGNTSKDQLQSTYRCIFV